MDQSKDEAHGSSSNKGIDDDNGSVKSRKKCIRCKDYFEEYTSNTSLHGLKYIGESERTTVEKIWWILMFLLSFGACIYLIDKLLIKWNESPVIVSFAQSSTSIFEVPFPAVTICPENKSKQTVFNFTEMHYKRNNLTRDELVKFETIALTCNPNVTTVGRATINATNIDFLSEVTPSLDETFIICLWKSFTYPCNEMFTKILTDNGICYTFNMYNATELFRETDYRDQYNYLKHERASTGWTLEKGYQDDISDSIKNTDVYPFRGIGSGVLNGLTLLLEAKDQDLDYFCKGPVQGYRVSLHTPVEMPKISEQYIRLPFDQEVIAAIKPNMMTTSEGLRSYLPEVRRCFYADERKLEFFNVYTQNNCELECMAKYIYFVCGCVPFSMPKHENYNICDASNIICFIYARADLMQRKATVLRIDESKNISKAIRYLNEYVKNCNCVPACTVIQYDMEISQTPLDWQKNFISSQDNTTGRHFSRLQLFFKQDDFTSSYRSELYGITDFLANCGGLLGLCLGFSVLSLIEIVYFLTLRPICNLKLRLSKRSVAPEKRQ